MLARVVLIVLISGIAISVAAQNTNPPPEKRAQTVTVTGTLTDEGVECQALRADDGTLYTLTGDLKKFKTGDRVTVTGTVAEISICMQGATIAVERIEKAK
jgi:hypothetical protein